ncbi:SH3 domain-containing protein [Pseudaestuariivita atlantica]|uniref:SH3 domain-containing protein n=1 Tax=Pseudaestuariivita atlantica TaxID=1317121 RepID=UPI0013F41944|nr:SH3 domain-containing protein [Pseudaestuariivita atlantica]
MCFLFLGWAFWELSGGSDFEPTVQARAPQEVDEQPLEATDLADTVTRAATVSTISPQKDEAKAGVTLASVEAPATEPEAAPEPAALVDSVVADILAEPAETETVTTAPALDLREIVGNRVNMRQGPGTEFGVVTKLNQGAEVEVLQAPGNGWLKLRVIEDDTVGWIADWLVTSAS